MAEDILFLIHTLGGRGGIRSITKKIKSINFIGQYYNVSFYLGEHIKTIPIKIFKKVRKDKSFFYKSANRVSIDVLPSTPSQVYGITIESKSQLYITDNFCITHNSTLAMQLAYVVDQNLSLNNIVFTANQLEKRITECKPNTAILMDEAFNGLSSKGAISKENRRLVRILMMMRQRNLFLFIVLPSFFLLEKYVALFRSTALFNVLVSRKNFKLRYYKVYNYNKKRELYIKGKNLMDYSRPKIPKSYRFYRKLPPTINEEAYRLKKLETFRDEGKEESEESRIMKQRNFLFYVLKENYNLSYIEIAKLLENDDIGLNESVIGRIVRDVSKKRQKT